MEIIHALWLPIFLISQSYSKIKTIYWITKKIYGLSALPEKTYFKLIIDFPLSNADSMWIRHILDTNFIAMFHFAGMSEANSFITKFF